MGNCIQTQKAPTTSTTVSEPKGLNHDEGAEPVMIEIPIQDGSVSEISGSKPPASSFREPSSREEMFYDSNLSIDSDCEDFYSANGDTTPSLDDTTIHKNKAGETVQVEKSIPIDDTTRDSQQKTIPIDDTTTDSQQREPSSNKLLIEFLDHDSFNNDGNQMSVQEPDQQADPSISIVPPKSVNKSSYASLVNLVCRGKKSQNKTLSSPGNGQAKWPAKACLPNLVQSLSFNQKKKELNTA